MNPSERNGYKYYFFSIFFSSMSSIVFVFLLEESYVHIFVQNISWNIFKTSFLSSYQTASSNIDVFFLDEFNDLDERTQLLAKTNQSLSKIYVSSFLGDELRFNNHSFLELPIFDSSPFSVNYRCYPRSKGVAGSMFFPAHAFESTEVGINSKNRFRLLCVPLNSNSKTLEAVNIFDNFSVREFTNSLRKKTTIVLLKKTDAEKIKIIQSSSVDFLNQFMNNRYYVFYNPHYLDYFLLLCATFFMMLYMMLFGLNKALLLVFVCFISSVFLYNFDQYYLTMQWLIAMWSLATFVFLLVCKLVLFAINQRRVKIFKLNFNRGVDNIDSVEQLLVKIHDLCSGEFLYFKAFFHNPISGKMGSQLRIDQKKNEMSRFYSSFVFTPFNDERLKYIKGARAADVKIAVSSNSMSIGMCDLKMHYYFFEADFVEAIIHYLAEQIPKQMKKIYSQ